MKKYLIPILVLLIAVLSVSILMLISLNPDFSDRRSEKNSRKEHYIFVGMMWNHPVWQQARSGGLQAASFWNGLGSDISIDFVGPDEGDIDGVHAALRSAVSQNPTGIIYLDQTTGYEEEIGKLLTRYHEGGGMISSLVGVGSNGGWPVDHIGGIDNFAFGREMAEWAISIKGEAFTVGIMTVSDNFQHRQRMMGILEEFESYPEITIISPPMEETFTPEGAVSNAIGFLGDHPEVDVLLGTAAQSAGALGRAAKTLGSQPGDILILGADQDPDMVSMVREGYVHGSLGYSFAADIFSSVSWMHMQNERAVSFTKYDEEYNLWVIPRRSITPAIRFTKENIDLIIDLSLK